MKRRISFLLVLAMLLASFGALTTDTESAVLNEVKEESKITEALEKRISEAKDGEELIPYTYGSPISTMTRY